MRTHTWIDDGVLKERGVMVLVVESEEGVERATFHPGKLGAGERKRLTEGTVMGEGKGAKQIREYLKGGRRDFDVDLIVSGTEFQKAAWRTIMDIPYGETRTYKWVAEQIGVPKGARAVGGAMGSNDIVLIIPCHRIVGCNGPGGFGGRVDVKLALQQLESRS